MPRAFPAVFPAPLRLLGPFALLLSLLLGAAASAQNTYTVNLFTDTQAGTLQSGGGFGPGVTSGGYDLRGAMFAAMAAGGANTINFACSAPPCTITLAAPLPPIFELSSNTGATAPSAFSLTIDGGTAGNIVIDGNNAYRVFWVDNVAVTLRNLVIQNALAQGGSGSILGGGGAGFGAGLFVNQSSANVTVQNTTFTNLSVKGGFGSGAGGYSGGGGGLGFNGASVQGGGGGGGVSSAASGINGGAGGGGASASGGSVGTAYANNDPGFPGVNGNGGNGGFGGGGGGSNATGGNGGFGAGGGGSFVNGGNGGFGGGAGSGYTGSNGSLAPTVGGISGGGASNGPNGSGGGGAAAGPAIFVVSGSVTLFNTSGSSFTATPGGSINPGTADATPVFNYGGRVNGSTSVGPIRNAFTVTRPVGQTSATQLATLTFTTAVTSANAFTINVLTQGATGQDFAFVSGGTCASGIAYAVGATCTVAYTFTPKFPGLRAGGVTLTSPIAVTTANPKGTIASTLVSGTGTGPMLAFNPGTVTTLGGGFSSPWGIAVDGGGNVFVADYLNSAIKVMTSDCAANSLTCVTTLGSGFLLPSGVAVDGVGNVFVADSHNNAVKMMPPDCTGACTITTLGGGFDHPYGIALDSAGNVFVADSFNNAIKKIPSGCVSSGCVVSLGRSFSGPDGVAVDSNGNIYVAETDASAIHVMPPGCSSATCVSTLGGGFSSPYHVAVDPSGNVYVADQNGGSVKSMPSTCTSASCVTTLASISSPYGVALDSSGNVYFSGATDATVNVLNRAAPPTVGFPTATNAGATDTTDGTKTVTLSNVGNAPLYFGIPLSGTTNPTTPADFTVNASSAAACPALTSSASHTGTLLPGGANDCVVPITFTPRIIASGAISQSLVFTNNNLNNGNGTGTTGAVTTATQSITLTGTAVPTATVTAISPNSTPTIQTQPTTVTVTGTNFVPGNTSVSFGSTTIPASSVTVNSTTSLTFTMPASSTMGVVDIRVQNASNGMYSATSPVDQFSYVGPQTVATSFSPDTISAGGTSTFSATLTNPNQLQPIVGVIAVSVPPTGVSVSSIATTCGGSVNQGPGVVAVVGNTIPAAGSCTISFTASSTTPGHYVQTFTASSLYGAPSVDAALTVMGSTTTTLAVADTPATYSSFATATVTPVASATGTPTGNVSFYVDSSTTPTVMPLTGNTANLSLQGLATGPHTVSATYTPDANSPYLLTSSSTPPTAFNYVQPSYVVTSNADATGNATNCPIANSPANTTCTLRDALTAANATGGGTITFSPSAFAAANTAAQNTISLVAGLSVPNNTTITGLTGGTGSSLKNLVTIAGAGVANQFSLFTLGSLTNTNVTATIANLNLTNGYAGVGGGIQNYGTLTVLGSTIANNVAGIGGGIYSLGTVTVRNSTIANNAQPSNGGQGTGIFFAPRGLSGATLTISNTTITGNHGTIGAAISVQGNPVVTITNSTIASNASDDDYEINGIAASPSLTISNSILSTIGFSYTSSNNIFNTTNLTALGNYGGPTQTMLPLPGSAAICAATVSNNQTYADQRGATHASTYCTASQMDAGAVQTNYTLGFTTQPPSTGAVVDAAMTPAPIVQLQENSLPFAQASLPVTLTDANNAITSGNAGISTEASGAASFSNLRFTNVQSSDTLNASLPLSITGTLPTTLTATSTAFAISQGAASITLNNLSQTYTGSPLAVTATTTPTNLTAISITYTGISGTTYGPSTTAPTNAGTYSAEATLSNTNYTATPATNTFIILQKSASVTLSNLSQVYTGSPLAATAVTTPSGLSLAYTYVGTGATTYASSTTPPTHAGTYNVSATITDLNYTGSASPTAFTITKATPTIVTAPTASSITYGAALSTATLNGGSAAVPGSFAWTTPGTVPSAGTTGFSVTFTPTDVADYNTTALTVDLEVSKATPTITTAPTTSSLVYGQALSSSTLSGGVASTTGTFAWTTPTTQPNAGVASYSVTFTPTDLNNYNIATGNATITTSKAPVTITWAPPLDVVYGTSLTAAQLNATASVPGTLSYSPAAGAVLPSGGHTLSVNFTPIDSRNYSTPATTTVNLIVTAAPLAVSVDSLTRAYGAANPTLTGTPSGLVNSDTATSIGLAYSTTATQSSAAGRYSITATITSANYVLTVTPGVLSITGASLTVAASNATKVYGTANPSFSGSITGQQNGDTFAATYTTTATTNSTVGSYAIVPNVTGAQLANYTLSQSNGTLTISQAASSLALSASATNITPGQSVTLTATAGNATPSSSGIPTGTVSFYNGTTLLGTSSLANGVATFTTNTLAAGANYALSARYSGDTNFTGTATDASISVTVTPLNFTLTPPATTSLTVMPGGSVQTSFTIAPLYGSFPGQVNFTATGLPTGATITFSPTTLAADTSSPQTITVTIHAPAATAQSQSPRPGRSTPLIALGVLLLPLLATRRVRTTSLLRTALLLVLSLVGIGALSGCASGNGFNATAPQNYTVTMTATAGSLTQSFQINLNVQ